MSFLAINGIEFPGAIDSASEEAREIGETTSAFDGTLRKSRQSVKRDLRLSSTPMNAATYLAWASLLRGLGEKFNFNTSLYSSKGLGPSTATDATIVTAHPKFGAGNLSLAATTGELVYPTGLGSSWTVALWRYEGAAWVHYLVTSGGDKWVDGVQDNGATTTWLTVSTTTTLANASGSAVEYDDLVVLPFVVPSTWPAVLGVSASAFSELPRLTATGDAIEETTRTVLAEVASKYVAGVISSFATTHRVMAVSLSQV